MVAFLAVAIEDADLGCAQALPSEDDPVLAVDSNAVGAFKLIGY